MCTNTFVWNLTSRQLDDVTYARIHQGRMTLHHRSSREESLPRSLLSRGVSREESLFGEESLARSLSRGVSSCEESLSRGVSRKESLTRSLSREESLARSLSCEESLGEYSLHTAGWYAIKNDENVPYLSAVSLALSVVRQYNAKRINRRRGARAFTEATG